jgi:ribonuclease R
MISMVVLRSQSQAALITAPKIRVILASRSSVMPTFTSPIRRYADLVVHRAPHQCLWPWRRWHQPPKSWRDLDDMGEHISATERRSALAERDSRLTATPRIYLAERTGAFFEGRVTGVTRFGLFVELS